MPDFARWVGGKLGLVVVDKTGLTGVYDFKANWTVEPDPSPGPDADPRDPLRSAVFAALREQLGLRIIPQRITLDKLVIDSVEKPADN